MDARLTNDQILHHLQTTVNSPAFSDAILTAAEVTEQFDPTQTGAWYADGTTRLPWQTMVTPLIFDEEEKLTPEILKHRVDLARHDITRMFRSMAAGQTICFRRGYRFRCLDPKAEPTSLRYHVPIVSRFATFPTEATPLTQIVPEGHEYRVYPA